MTTLRGPITFTFLSSFPLKKKATLKLFILHLFTQEHVPLSSLHYIFCTDEFLLDLNRRFLSHDTYTDVLTFPMSAPGSPVTGEVYISIDRIRENATALHQSLYAELLRVMIHGALHLCGYKDKSTQQRKQMTAKEDYYLLCYFTDSTWNM